MSKKENLYQQQLVKRLKAEFPDCVVLKNDSGYIQGIPDLSIFFGDRWATLETKRNSGASHRPNQDYYVERLDSMSFSRFIFPENEDEVIAELRKHFGRRTNNE